jgi:hypothetical protein
MDECTFNKGGKCVALRDKSCKGCAFRKTSTQLEDSRTKAWERIEALPDKARVKIRFKYYNKPVKEG